MTIRDAVGIWPPAVWVGSRGSMDPLTPDSNTAIIVSAKSDEHGVYLTVKDRGVESSTVLEADSALVQKIVSTLSNAKGKTIIEAGNLTI